MADPLGPSILSALFLIVSALVYAIKNTVSDIGYVLNIVFSQTSQFIGNLI